MLVSAVDLSTCFALLSLFWTLSKSTEFTVDQMEAIEYVAESF